MGTGVAIVAPARPPWQAYVALGLGVVCIALSALWVKWANIPGPSSAFYRMLIPMVVLVPWWLARRSKDKPLERRPTAQALAGGVFFALDIIVWNSAILLTSAANATLLANNAPLWVGLGALILLRERLPRAFWPSMAISLIGILLVLGGDLLRHPDLGLGDGLALLASVFYAGYLLVTQQARVRMDTLTFMTLSTVAGVVLLLVVCLALGSPLTGFSTDTWLALVGLGLVSHLGGWLAINYALGHISASLASVSLLGQPVLTALLAIPLFGEYLRWEQIVGGALVLFGIWLVNRR